MAGGSPVARGRPHVIDFDQPGFELLQQIGEVDEAAHLEETSLHPADEILDSPLLVSRPRSAQLDGQGVIEGQLRQGAVPDDGRLLRVDDDGLRVIEHDREWRAAASCKRTQQCARERFYLLVGIRPAIPWCVHPQVDGGVMAECRGG
ncbi:MAG: hypothetical protein ACREMQ_05775 [Longimicrobiales bacterium]